MGVCNFCESLVLGGECTNLNCEHSRETRKIETVKKLESSEKKASKDQTRKRKSSTKGAYSKYVQEDGTILVPVEIHLQYEVSLPNFMGYKTDKKAERNIRRSALKLLFESDFRTHSKALNKTAIDDFGPPNSAKRKNKIISWFGGRIYKSKSKNLQNSKEKLVEDREYVINNF
jgi:hypothetical protein